jgi:uracil-DNA glycosylase family protein
MATERSRKRTGDSWIMSTSEDALPEAAQRAAIDGEADLDAVRSAAGGCRACHLWAHATQTVFGRGAVPARWMLVGEQPGDREDLAGAPFVGPAGQLLDRALVEAGIDREASFVTNVVKHFKWRPSGKRRLHDRPNREEVGACLPWVKAELELVRPSVLVLMGATAGQALLGSAIRVTRDRGRPITSDLAPHVLLTIHPSAVLRARSSAERAAATAGFVDDLRLASRLG